MPIHTTDSYLILFFYRTRLKDEFLKEYHAAVMEVFPWFCLEEPAKHWAEWEPRHCITPLPPPPHPYVNVLSLSLQTQNLIELIKYPMVRVI
jgi:hypothetical protein